MSRNRNLLSLVLVGLLFLIPRTSIVSSQGKHTEFWQLVETVKDILAGKNIEQVKATISKGARLVYGTKFQNLKEVVAGEAKTCSLADSSYQGVMIQAQTNPSEDMGFLVLKTVTRDNTKVRFHTVVFLKDSTGQFRIISWHTGD